MTKPTDPLDLAEDEYVVSRIAGRKVEDKIRYYLIEWDGYALNENTWEEEENVYSEQTIQAFISAYKRQYRVKSLPKDNTQKILLRNTYDPDTKSYHKPTNTTTTTIQKATVITKSTVVNGNSTVTAIVQKQQQQPQPKSSKKRGRDLIETETESVNISKPVKEARIGLQNLTLGDHFSSFKEKMKAVKESVKMDYPLVRSLNNHYKNNAPIYHFKNLKARVTVVNEVDSELPTDFIYVDQLKYTAPVQPPDPDFLPGCQCVDRDCSAGCHDVIAYDRNGRLLINQGTAIYECNQSCECGPKCKNRVVQKGRKLPLQVFKTPSKGWGVRSNHFISKGTFIEEYIGEVIKVEEGDARGAVYDKLGCSYLFDMDFAQSELPTAYVIDSYTLGNVSRFFNHSCSPNLEVYAVFYDSADNQMHRLAFFAKRDIQKDEELCFDYNGRRDVTEDLDGENASRYSCHCNATECRKWIYH